MKVDRQGSAADYNPVKSEANKQQIAEKISEAKETKSKGQVKLNAEDLKTTQRVDEEDLRSATNVMNEAMKISNYHLQFKVHKESGRVQVKVIDSDSNKVIREIPPDKVLECSAKIKEMLDHMAGILVDELA